MSKTSESDHGVEPQNVVAMRRIVSPESDVDAREYRLFRSLDTHSEGKIFVADLLDSFKQVGLNADDGRLRKTMSRLERFGLRDQLSVE